MDAVEKLGEQPVDLLEINISCPNVKDEIGRVGYVVSIVGYVESRAVTVCRVFAGVCISSA